MPTFRHCTGQTLGTSYNPPVIVMAENDERKDGDALEIAASDARDRFGELIDRALSGERVVITRSGRRVATLISLRDAERFAALERAVA